MMAVVIAIAAATTIFLDGAIKLENLLTRRLFSTKFLHTFYLYILLQPRYLCFLLTFSTNLLTCVPHSNSTIDNWVTSTLFAGGQLRLNYYLGSLSWL